MTSRGPTGTYVTLSSTSNAAAFVPNPLPPVPPLSVDASLRQLLDRALLALGRLDSISSLLPNPDLFLYSYVRKEALLSSQIEGTQSSLADLLLFEVDAAPGVPFDDVVEVSNYVAALEHGLRRIQEGFPLSNRLIRELHEVLMRRGRGVEKQPGEFRAVQNWLGGPNPERAVFVPPPPDRVQDCMASLERFLHDEPEPTPALIKAALAHCSRQQRRDNSEASRRSRSIGSRQGPCAWATRCYCTPTPRSTTARADDHHRPPGEQNRSIDTRSDCRR